VNFKLTTIIAAVSASVLAACGPDKVSFDTLETARTQAKSNAEYNAQVYRSAAPQYANFGIIVQGDSSQTPECPQGDGWASGNLIDKADPANKVALKCSTVSGAVGCLTQAEFQTKPYAADDGHCQGTDKVPFPVPKVAK
jgi:hypothetical protein